MTATLVYPRPSKAGTGASGHKISSINSSSMASHHRRIKVSSRLAPQIYLGHIWRKNQSDQAAARAVVVKCAGQLSRDAAGKLQGPWKEWQAARQLRSVPQSHPNVVQVFDTFVQRSHVFVVMEHCARGDLLTDLMATQPQSRLGQRHALRIVLDLARGLQFLHSVCNIAHRDVSLENVFVTRDGSYKLGDFGLSTRADTKASGCVGKTQYVAPEVVGEASYDPMTADVWSLGILLFMLVTGCPLLQFASPISSEFLAVKAMGCRGVLKAWKMDTLLSYATIDLLSKMLEFEPSKRLRDMTEVLNHPALLAASRRADTEAQQAARTQAGNPVAAASR